MCFNSLFWGAPSLLSDMHSAPEGVQEGFLVVFLIFALFWLRVVVLAPLLFLGQWIQDGAKELGPRGASWVVLISSPWLEEAGSISREHLKVLKPKGPSIFFFPFPPLLLFR